MNLFDKKLGELTVQDIFDLINTVIYAVFIVWGFMWVVDAIINF